MISFKSLRYNFLLKKKKRLINKVIKLTHILLKMEMSVPIIRNGTGGNYVNNASK